MDEMKELGIDKLPEEFSLRLWDTMGWSDSAYQHGEMNYILDGHIPDRFELDIEVRVYMMTSHRAKDSNAII